MRLYQQIRASIARPAVVGAAGAVLVCWRRVERNTGGPYQVPHRGGQDGRQAVVFSGGYNGYVLELRY